MAGSLTTRGVVLKRRVYGEADRILTILTPGFGRIEAIAKGSRRITSRLGGHLELFYLVDWVLADGRTWHVVTSADTIETFPELRASLASVRQAGHISRLVSRVLPEGEGSRALFELIVRTLGALGPMSSPLVLRQFEWQLLLELGLQPELRQCSHCGSALDPKQLGLCPTRGGALCPDCLQSEQVHVPISRETLKVLRLFERAPSILAPRLVVPRFVERELERVTKAFLEHTLEAPLLFERDQTSKQPVSQLETSQPDYQTRSLLV